MASQQWGHADSIPPRVQDGMCRIALGATGAVQPVSDSSLVDTSFGDLGPTDRLPDDLTRALSPADLASLQAAMAASEPSAGNSQVSSANKRRRRRRRRSDNRPSGGWV